MGKKHTPSTRKRALSKQKNKIRGLIASGKSHAYTPKAHDKVGQVRRDLSDALAAAGALGLAAGGKFLRWADAQVAQQLPELRSKPPVSELTTDALERKPRALTIEIEWASELLRPHLSEIIAFRALADQVEEAALLENWSEAVARLEDVESTFGRSIWWLEAHIAIQQAHQGLDAQKQWTASYRDLRPGSLQSYLARFFSVRNEPSTTLNSFLKDVDERVGRLKQQPTLQGYLRTKLLWNAPLSQRELAQSLVVAQSLAPVDLYETLLDALHHGFVFNYSQSLGETIRRALSTLRAISDSRVLTLAMLAERSTYNLPPHRPYAASDNAVSASATNVLAACTRELAQAPRAFRTALSSPLRNCRQ